MDFHHPTILSGLLLQGDTDNECWVVSFVVSYSSDCEHFNFIRTLNESYKVSDVRVGMGRAGRA